MIMFWRALLIILESLRSLKFVATCKRLDSYMRLVCPRTAISIWHYQRVGGKMEAENKQFSPSMRLVYNHTQRCNVTTRSINGWASYHGINDRSEQSGFLPITVEEGFRQVRSRGPSGDYHFYVLRSVGKSTDVRHQCVVGSVYNGENALIGPGVAINQVEATNFVATVRSERVSQVELAEE
ncbi:hypothetical protein PVK06_017135 [Gossypium arboreum]|uniref:Uncharacterized protein n=1 Tax=Gossypium arboreum TaxID=29729 RepID=A0ABR0Q2P0_GOSAR|nr:hypothetical protein PVK06_017135 [Gossypium arboreum]